jgi:hypothetical protein
MRVELIDPEGTLLSEIADKRMKRADIASSYALAMSTPDVDWRKINHAIMDRWSLAGLKWIKERAWKLRRQP